jgi:hypothetical protein
MSPIREKCNGRDSHERDCGKVRRSSIVYMDKWKGYDSLMFSGYKHLNIDHRYKFKERKVFIMA